MQITFFGYKDTFDYYQIGGTDSFFRRLASEFAASGQQVSFVRYGCQRNLIEHPVPGITIHRFVSFYDALNKLSTCMGCVLVYTVHRRDRLNFIRFRQKTKHRIKFFFVAALFSESWMKRNLHLLEAMMYPYNGGTLCMSPRLVKACRLRRNKAELLLPPVPDHYYVRPEDKPRRNKLVVTYMGRTVPGKGADEAVEIFKQLHGEDDIVTQVYGYIWPNNWEDRSIHNWLVDQDNIKYVCEEYKGWSPEVDRKVAETLKNTDILLLPYKWLSSTMDMPLLLLEGMAANCCIITKPLGDIPKVYGESPFIMPQRNFVDNAAHLVEQVKNYPQLLKEERKRVRQQTTKWAFDAHSVASKLLCYIGGQ